MSDLSNAIDRLPYALGKVEIYKSCRLGAVRHIEFWNSPDRSNFGATPEQRASYIQDATATIVRCDKMITYWQDQAGIRRLAA